MITNHCIAGKSGGGKVWRIDFFEPLQKKVWRINRSDNRLLIVSTNLDGFSLVNHEQFAKFTKSPPPNFPAILYIEWCYEYGSNII